MSNQNMPEDPDIRRKKLDELFADEPFLSPTMRARRLHEKLQEAKANGSSAAGAQQDYVVPGANGDSNSTKYNGSRMGGTAKQRNSQLPLRLVSTDRNEPDAQDPIDLRTAARILRRGASSMDELTDHGRITRAGAVRLARFRDGELKAWIRTPGIKEPD